MNLGRHQMKPLYLHSRGTSPEVQWLRLRVPNTEHRGWIPGWGTKIRMPSSASKEHKKTSKQSLHYKSAQQGKANQVNKAFSENRSKWSLHVQRNVEADVEKQSFPNLSVKFLFKDNWHELQKEHPTLRKQASLIFISVPQQAVSNGNPCI